MAHEPFVETFTQFCEKSSLRIVTGLRPDPMNRCMSIYGSSNLARELHRSHQVGCLPEVDALSDSPLIPPWRSSGL